MSAYYTPISRHSADDGVTAHYQSTVHAQGAWNDFEQHMAPATGLMAYELERFFERDDMQIGRISLDILGVIFGGETIVRTQFVRTGKTIELIESTLSTFDKKGVERTSIILRAWRMATCDSSAIAALEEPAMLPADTQITDLPVWHGMQSWSGGFIKSLQARIQTHRPGKACVWLHSDLPLVAGEPTSDFVRMIGLVDCANGVAGRISPEYNLDKWIYPNLDLQIHLHRQPAGQWLGVETIQQFGTQGIGLTSSVLHDAQGVFGHAEQILTVRQLP